jgi:putative ABC transport system permease protein
VLAALGVLLVVLSAFLITNTVAALLMQQTRQIGVMKAIGAGEGAIVAMYLAFVAALGALAFALAVPLGALAAYGATALMAGLFNFDATGFRLVPWVVALQAAVSLLVPLAAALAPVLGGTRITIRDAIASYGLGRGRFGQGRLDRALERVRFLSRPLALALRNTFRRKGRLALTLVTLTLGGAIFVSVYTVQDSLALTVEDLMNYFGEDIRVSFSRPYRNDQIDQVVRQVPGVAGVEHWAFLGTRRLRPDGTESKSVVVMAPPVDTRLLRPTILRGRWLVPGDQSALVVTTDMLKEEPDAQVGSRITLKVGERETEWTIVGVIPQLGNSSGFLTYASYDYVVQVGRSVGQSGNARIVTARHDAESQRAAAQELERAFRGAGMRVSSIETNTTFRQQMKSQLDVIVVFLMVMAALITVVGGLGLMGTMSMNVIERTREIGVLRAIGASNGSVVQIVVAEGVMIGLISWALAALLSIPLSRFLSDSVGTAFLRSPLTFSYSAGGLAYWLALVTAIAALASLLPAWSAARLAVREVLAYEG